jgi:hypothetical protein
MKHPGSLEEIHTIDSIRKDFSPPRSSLSAVSYHTEWTGAQSALYVCFGDGEIHIHNSIDARRAH